MISKMRHDRKRKPESAIVAAGVLLLVRIFDRCGESESTANDSSDGSVVRQARARVESKCTQLLCVLMSVGLEWSRAICGQSGLGMLACPRGCESCSMTHDKLQSVRRKSRQLAAELLEQKRRERNNAIVTN